jgi:hypothetical protein
MSDDDLGLGSLAAPSAAAPRRPWPSERFVLTVWALLTIAATVAFLASREHQASTDPLTHAANGEVTGLAPLSLIRPDRFGAALAAARSHTPGGRVLTLRLEPTELQLQLRTTGFHVDYLSVDVALHVTQPATGETNQHTIPFARIDPAAPRHALDAVNLLTHTVPTDVDHVSLNVDRDHPSRSTWTVALASGTPPDQRQYTTALTGADAKPSG